MSKESIFIPDNRHIYQVNERVKCINVQHEMCGCYGTVIKHMQHWFQYPGYDVLWDGESKVMAMSERSLERIEEEKDNG